MKDRNTSEFICEPAVNFIRSIYGSGVIPLHRPVFVGNEKQYLNDCIDSNFVSSVGEKVTNFEKLISEFTGSKFAIATVNGTSARFTYTATANQTTFTGADINGNTLAYDASFIDLLYFDMCLPLYVEK